MTAGELQETLQHLNLRDMRIRVEGRPGHLVAEISSPDFNNQDESARQQTVWEYLIRALSDEDRVEVEFVFTRTPEEMQLAASRA
jgi:acid stress-induced BolA-like protein IbaG/YrbA